MIGKTVIVYAGSFYGCQHVVVATDGNLITCRRGSYCVVVHRCDVEVVP